TLFRSPLVGNCAPLCLPRLVALANSQIAPTTGRALLHRRRRALPLAPQLNLLLQALLAAAVQRALGLGSSQRLRAQAVPPWLVALGVRFVLLTPVPLLRSYWAFPQWPSAAPLWLQPKVALRWPARLALALQQPVLALLAKVAHQQVGLRFVARWAAFQLLAPLVPLPRLGPHAH